MAEQRPRIPEDEKRKVEAELRRVGAWLPCPRCSNRNFAVLDAYFNHVVTNDTATVNVSGTTVPTAVILCTRCGFIAEHALGVLGLLRKEPDKEEGVKK